MGPGKRNGLLALVALILAAALLYTLQPSGKPGQQDRPPAPGEPAAAVEQGELLEAARGAPQSGDRGEVEQPSNLAAVPPYQEEGLLEGEVLTSDGRPIIAARVELRRRNARSFNSLDLEYFREAPVIAATDTDEAGHFEFRAPRHRSFQLHASAPGFAKEILVDCYAGEHYSIALQPGTVLEGQITTKEDHIPVAGVRLKAVRPFEFELEASSDGRGFYRFEDLPPGTVMVEVLPLRHVSSRFGLTIEPGQVLRRDIQLESGGSVTGTVTDASTGRPVQGAEIGEGWTFQRIVRTDANGYYELIGFPPPGILDVAVRAKGYGQQLQRIDDSAENERVMDFQLLSAGSANGRIVNDESAPLRGVYVAGVASERDENQEQQIDWQAVRTDDAGRFLIENLRPDLPHALIVRHAPYGTLVYEFPGLPKPEGSVEFGDVILRPGGTVLGRVVDAEGQGLPSISLVFRGTNADRFRYAEHLASDRSPAGWPYVDRRNLQSDANGGFRLTDLSPGTYTVGMSRLRFEEPAEVLIQEWGQVIDDLVLVAQRGLSISGVVVTPDRTPARDGVVTARPEGGGRFGGSGLRGNEFRIDGLQPGTYTLTASSDLREVDNPWLDGRLRAVPAGSEDVVIVVARRSFVEGVVLDAQGSPAPGIAVRARVSESYLPRGRDTVLTDDSGRFRLVVGEGEILDIMAGPPAASFRPGSTPMPDERRSVTVPDISAGSENVVIRLR